MATEFTVRKGMRTPITTRFRPGGSEYAVAPTTQVDFIVKPSETGSSVLTLQSTPAAGGGDDQIERLAAESQSSVAITAFTVSSNTYIIEAGTATFVTNNVQKDEEVTISGSTSNDGTYTVKRRISETKIEVNETLTAEAAAGNVSVSRGEGWLKITFDVADAALLDFKKGFGVLQFTESGGEPTFGGDYCINVKDAP